MIPQFQHLRTTKQVRFIRKTLGLVSALAKSAPPLFPNIHFSCRTRNNQNVSGETARTRHCWLTEGTGLLLRKRWAEYFTIITTGGLIPLELYELSRHVTAVKIAVLIVNVAIVAYLVARVRKTR